MEKSDSQDTTMSADSSSGWPIVSLDEVCSITSGITKGRRPPPEPLREVPYMAVVNVQDGRLNLETVKTIQASLSEIERFRLLPGDLLLTEGGDPDKLGRGTVWSGEIGDCIHQNHIFRVRASSSLINTSFLSRLVASPAGKAYFLSKAKQTTGIASINLTQLRNFPVPLAPLNEQRRIAAKLDTALAAVESCRQRLDGVEALLKRFRQAVLAAATSGELTREWREERGIDDPEATTLGDIIKVSSGKFMPAKAMDPSGTIPVYGGNGIAGYHSEANVDEPTVAIGRVGFYCGSVHLTPEKAWVTDNALIVKSKRSEMDRDFLYYALLGTNLRSNDSSTAQPVISGAKIYPVPFLIPSFDEQREIVARVEALFSLADQLEAKLTAARRIVERLTPALLAKAFRGELVPQDPNDEPASVLLERIRAARLAEAAAGKPSRRGRKQVAAIPAAGVSDAAPVPPDSLPPDLLTCLLRECGPLTERALLAASELRPETFRVQLAREQDLGAVRVSRDAGQVLLEAVA